MSNRSSFFTAAALLGIMFLMSVSSIKDDSLTFDETAHIIAGYSYLTQKDMRLNPEHPPLLKDLAAFPLLFLNSTLYRGLSPASLRETGRAGAGLNFPKDHASWLQEENPVWWHQFELGSQFLYHSGNNPDQILLWSRMPMILLLIFLGWFIFLWARELFGNKAAVLSLFLFTFSPTFLAHGRLVTTDVGAALGVVISTYFWLKFLKNPGKKNVFLAGLAFGIAMLFKFSLILLIPFFAGITLIYAWLKNEKGRLYRMLKYAGLALLAAIIGIVFIIWPVYQYHVLDYPRARQIRDAQFLLSTAAAPQVLIDLDQWLIQSPVFRALGQYLLGILLVINRGTTGHTTYFLGEISAASRRIYFPLVYLIKETLVFHILTLIAILAWAFAIKKPFWQNPLSRIKNWIKSHFQEFAMLCFIALYWVVSLKTNLNLGVRHLLPLFPFTILLVSAKITSLLQKPFLRIKSILLLLLLSWQIISVTSIHPHFLAYFNGLVRGPDYGHIYVVDSNLDWGQDLKRLAKWVNTNNVGEIYIDYFGGGNPEYYFQEKYMPWWGIRDPKEFEKPNYLAVSASLLQGGKGIPAPEFDQPSGYYLWLEQYQPVATIGHSIFVYYVE